METGMLHLHSALRWVILVLLLASMYTTYTATDGRNKKIWLFTLIASHIMLIVGIYQWFWGRYGWLKMNIPEGTSVMKDKFLRFFLVEHPVTMIIAILLITIANRHTKTGAYKKAFWFFTIALALLLIMIPWPFRDIIGEGRGWIPGMK